MRSRKDGSHTRREVEKSLRKYYSSQRTDSSDWNRRKSLGVGFPGEKQKHMTISFENFMDTVFRRCEKF